MHGLELKVPPPVVAALVAMLMWLAAWAVPALRFEMPGRRVIAGCVALAGVAVSIAGVMSFRRARTTVNPLKPESASSLVVSGVYRISRNPMYVGMLLVLLAWAVWLANVMALVIAPGFLLYMNRFQIGPEENALAKMFGEEYAAYRSRVRRWL
jgi:protein-S-isoprenylcysteine O-methyltransferase Ste14